MRRFAAPIAILAFVAPAFGSEGPPPVLNPRTYASPSGHYALFVDPGDMHGAGGATYRLAKDGKEVWAGARPYTLWDARVADDGTAGGYAYSHGWRGFPLAGPNPGPGTFRVVLLAPDGRERLNQVTKREESHFLHTPPNPLADELLFDPANDRMIVRVHDADVNRQAEAWWPYRISPGEVLPTFRPRELMADSEQAKWIRGARPIPGTPLILIQWWRYDYGNRLLRTFVMTNPRIGARFTLIEPDGKPVWTLDLPDDYMVGDDEARERLRQAIETHGAILRADEPGRFEIRRVKDGVRATFSVSRGGDGSWSVKEVERHPYVQPPTSPPSGPAIPVISPRLVGRIDLAVPGAGREPAIRDVSHFVFDDRGRIAFLRHGSATPALVVVDQKGDLLKTVPLDPEHIESRAGWSGLARVGGDRFLLIRDDPKNSARMDGWWADVSAGSMTPVAGFSTTVLSEVAGFPDGGFVVKGGLSYGRNSATGDNNLYGFDARGRPLWTVEHILNQDPNALFSPKDVTVTTDGKIAALDTCPARVHLFDRDGKRLRTIDLAKSWGRVPNYPATIVADVDGGFVVEDFGGRPSFVRMKVDGTVRAGVDPRFPDGRTFRVGDLAVAPDGALWVSDGHALLRLSPEGVVDRVLGEPPDARWFREAEAVTIDGRGRIYAVASRSGDVHVFDPDGRWLRVCRPGPDDIREKLSLPHMTVSDAGDVYLGVAGHEGGSYLHFAPDGRRVGIEGLGLDSIQEDWYAQPGTDRRWVLGYEKVFLVDGAGKTIRTIDRRPDRRWLESPREASVAPDGSIAVVSGAGIFATGPQAVSLYSAEGEPKLAFPLPESVAWSHPRIAYDGRRVVAIGEKEIVVFDASGKPLGRFTPAEGGEAWWTPFLTRSGRELVLFDGRKSLFRYEVP